MTAIQEYSFPSEYYATGHSRVTLEDGIHRCFHRETSGVDETQAYRPNCGAIAATAIAKRATRRQAGLYRLCSDRAVCTKAEVFLRREEPQVVPRGIHRDADSRKGDGKRVASRGQRGRDAAAPHQAPRRRWNPLIVIGAQLRWGLSLRLRRFLPMPSGPVTGSMKSRSPSPDDTCTISGSESQYSAG